MRHFLLHMTYEGGVPSRDVGLEKQHATSSSTLLTFGDLPNLENGSGLMLDSIGRNIPVANVQMVNGTLEFEDPRPDMQRTKDDQRPRIFKLKGLGSGVWSGLSSIDEMALIRIHASLTELKHLRDHTNTGE